VAQSPTEPRLDIAEARSLWAPERPYLNTASFGLPPRPAWEALQAALADWRHGRTSWEPWGEATAQARAAFARLVGVREEDVATSASASQLISLAAAALPEGARIVMPEGEFTSLVFPLLVRGDVREVPRERLADAVDADTDLVAVSAVQSSSGALTDLHAVCAAAESAGALVLVDATQAAGWLPLDAARVDFLVASAYKWLMSPRGTAFMAVRPDRLDSVPPLAANWWAGPDQYGTYYGGPLRLADEARRLDLSPAWFSWVGTAPALDLIERIGVEAIREHDVALANRFRVGLGLPPGDSAIVAADVPGAEERLAAAGIRASVRTGNVRVSFHVYNTERDVDEALDALGI
jgi:selenocysteine lyase/cysteine desulfurase